MTTMLPSKKLDEISALIHKFDPAALTQRVIAAGEDWADKNAAASSLEETRKSVLAKLAKEHARGAASLGDGKARPMSMVAAEQAALADPRYEAHIELMVSARQQSDRARVRYDMGKMELELMRSLQATVRQELRSA